MSQPPSKDDLGPIMILTASGDLRQFPSDWENPCNHSNPLEVPPIQARLLFLTAQGTRMVLTLNTHPRFLPSKATSCAENLREFFTAEIKRILDAGTQNEGVDR